MLRPYMLRHGSSQVSRCARPWFRRYSYEGSSQVRPQVVCPPFASTVTDARTQVCGELLKQAVPQIRLLQRADTAHTHLCG